MQKDLAIPALAFIVLYIIYKFFIIAVKSINNLYVLISSRVYTLDQINLKKLVMHVVFPIE